MRSNVIIFIGPNRADLAAGGGGGGGGGGGEGGGGEGCKCT